MIQELAHQLQATPAQVILRWHMQLGHVAIPKASSEARIRENLDVFGFELSERDMAAIAGLLEFVPTIGPLLSAIPAVAMGFLDSPDKALSVAIAYGAIQFLENNLLIPYLMREQLDLPPALTLVTQVLMAYVFGFLGLFVAIPMLATAVVTVRVLWIGEDEYARSGEEPPIEVLPVAPPEAEIAP